MPSPHPGKVAWLEAARPLVLLVMAALPIAVAQTLQTSESEFAKALNTVVKSLKAGQAPAADLPEATSCDKTKASYRCEWKSRANKASVTALEDAITTRVARALPDWKRDASVLKGSRFTRFTDPAKALVITVIGKATEDGAPPWDYTVRLNIEEARNRTY